MKFDYKIPRVFLLWLGIVIILALYRFGPIKLYYNHTPSLPIGYYMVRDIHFTNIRKSIYYGNLVQVCISDNSIARLAIQRKYLRSQKNACLNGTEFLLKRIIGLPNDVINIKNRHIYVNNYLIPNSKINLKDSKGNIMPNLLESQIIPQNKVLLLGETLDSFDSRYIGLFDISDIHGIAKKI